MKIMKYGIYEVIEERCTVYCYLPLSEDQEAQGMGFKKIDEARTQKEAAKLVKRGYINA